MIRPDQWLAVALAAGVLLLVKMALMSALETAVLNARRSRLANCGTPAEIEAAEALLESPETFQTSAHLTKSLCESLLYAVAALLGMAAALRSTGAYPQTLAELLERTWIGILLGALGAYLCVTVFGEAIPKSVATRAPERLVVRAVGFIRVFTLVFTPVRWITTRLTQVLALTAGAPLLNARAAHSEEEIRLLVEGSAEEGVLEEEEKEMIHSIFEFTDKVARQVMVPRIDVDSVASTATLGDVVQLALESGHSRLPVYAETLDNVVGVVHVKDLLPHLMVGNLARPVSDLMRDPYFIPEGKKIDELLHEFRRQRSPIAIVVDEYGGTSGVVTVEDVLEEIVGEIRDEYDVEEHAEPAPAEIGEGIVVDARMPIDDVRDELELELPHGDYDTIGGFVFSLFGRPPEPGEQVEWQGHLLVAEATDGLRLLRIRIIPPQPAPVEPPVAAEGLAG